MAELCFRVRSLTGDSARTVTAAIRNLGGVSGVEIDLHTSWVLVLGDRIDTTAIRKALHEAGHEAEL